MKILALETETAKTDSPEAGNLLKAEAAAVWELMQSGIIREIYFRQDYPSAVIMLECRDGSEAAEKLNTLPLVREGRIAFEIIPLVAYPGFERLFGPPETCPVPD